MESYINYTKTFNRLDKFVNEYNQEKPLKEQLRQAHADLMRQLIRIYAGFLRKQRGLGIESEYQYPPVFVNNVQLSKRCHCGPRTIHNLRGRLIEAGLIREKIFHGSNSSYELFLETNIISEPHEREKPHVKEIRQGKEMKRIKK